MPYQAIYGVNESQPLYENKEIQAAIKKYFDKYPLRGSDIDELLHLKQGYFQFFFVNTIYFSDKIATNDEQQEKSADDKSKSEKSADDKSKTKRHKSRERTFINRNFPPAVAALLNVSSRFDLAFNRLILTANSVMVNKFHCIQCRHVLAPAVHFGDIKRNYQLGDCALKFWTQLEQIQSHSSLVGQDVEKQPRFTKFLIQITNSFLRFPNSYLRTQLGQISP